APQLGFWRVHYVPAIDLALDPSYTDIDTLQEGELFQLPLSLVNLSGQQVDSVKIRYIIVSANNQQQAGEEVIGPVPAGEALTFTFSQNTRGFPGLNRLLVEVNPDKVPIEQTYENNVGARLFYVERDRRGPVLDVAFDGQRIIDGDLVSSQPFILISLKDENQYLALGDTSLLQIRLKSPSGVERKISFMEEGVKFLPAVPGRENRAVVEWQARLGEDGAYQLIVQGRDASGNESGEWEYRVRFEVINRRSISQILPYPNPFSTATRFVYTLTGDREPEYFLMRILTPSGRIVREVTKEEFGPMRIGTHLSDFVWDGTDNFGDRLANGVYLYQVVTKDGDKKDFESYENSQVDRFFKNNIGKIVILR
ncbi:MAG: hypothetical protein KDI06_22730, partial [Calditrichaeota bacterium]|nr:hypothetical protein [Calditrichota bacterium]